MELKYICQRSGELFTGHLDMYSGQITLRKQVPCERPVPDVHYGVRDAYGVNIQPAPRPLLTPHKRVPFDSDNRQALDMRRNLHIAYSSPPVTYDFYGGAIGYNTVVKETVGKLIFSPK